MSEQADVVPVVVAGAGPTGLTAATLLAQYGVRCLLVEQRPAPYPLPRAVHLDDEVFRILQSMGVAEAFAARSRPTLGLRLLDPAHRTIAEFPRADAVGRHGHPPANLFDQPELEQLLLDNLGSHRATCYEPGTELVSFSQHDGGPAPVRVRLQDAATGALRTVWTYALLGCDGARSTVRQQIGATLLDLHFEERWLVVDATSERRLPTWDGVHQVCDPHRAATYMQVGEHRYRWEFRLRDGETPTALRERLPQLLRPWLGPVPAEAVHVLRSAEYTFRARIADRWRDRRVFLLGDAAHQTPPFIGQGLGEGMRDAHNLCWKLARVLREGADPRLLDSYEAERRPHARRSIRLAVTVGWAMTGGQDRAAVVRRLLLRGLCAVPGVAAHVLDRPAPRIAAGPLVRRGVRPGLLGRTAPQPEVVSGGQRVRLDDVLGNGFALLGARPFPPSLVELGRDLDARVVRLGASASADPVQDPDGVLLRWLRQGRCDAVLLRPDRIVLAVASRGSDGTDLVRAVHSRLPLLGGRMYR